MKQSTDKTDKTPGEQVADRLIEIARARFTLWRTSEGIGYATDACTGETWGVESRDVRDRLLLAYHAETGRVVPTRSLQSAMRTVAMIATHDGLVKAAPEPEQN